MLLTVNQRFSSYWMSLIVLLACSNCVFSVGAINDSTYFKDTNLKKYQNKQFDNELEKHDAIRLFQRSLDYFDDRGLQRIPAETIEDFASYLEAARRGFGLPDRRAGPPGPFYPSAQRFSPMIKALIPMPTRNPYLDLPSTKVVAKIKPHLLRILGIVSRLHGLVHQTGLHPANADSTKIINSADSDDLKLNRKDVVVASNVRGVPVEIDNNGKETKKKDMSDRGVKSDGKTMPSEQKARGYKRVTPVVVSDGAQQESYPFNENDIHVTEHGDPGENALNREKQSKDANIAVDSVKLIESIDSNKSYQVAYQELNDVVTNPTPVLPTKHTQTGFFTSNNDVLQSVRQPTVLNKINLVSKRGQPRRTRLESRQKREEMNTKKDITSNDEALVKTINDGSSESISNQNNVHNKHTLNKKDTIKNDKSYIRRLLRSNPSSVPSGKGMPHITNFQAARDVHVVGSNKKEDAKSEVTEQPHVEHLQVKQNAQQPLPVSGDIEGGNSAHDPDGNGIVQLVATVDTNVTDDPTRDDHHKGRRPRLSSTSLRALAFLGLFLFIICFIMAIITKASCEGPRRTSSSMQLYSRSEPTTSYWT